MTVTFKQLTHDQIHPSTNNLRLEFDQESLDRLEDSIVSMGVLQALLVRKNEDGYEIVAGERRWRAIGQAIAKGRVPAEFPIPSTIKTAVTDELQTASMVVENLHRAGLTPIEEYKGLLRLANDYSWTVEQIAEATAIPKATVKARLSWAKLPADRLDALVATAGVTKVTELAALPADTQAKVLKAKPDKVITSMVTAIEAKGREDRARKMMAGLRRKGHLVITGLEDLTDPKFATEKALFDKLAKKAKKDGGEVRTKHLWHADLNDIDKEDLPIPTLFTVKVDQWNVTVEYFRIWMPFVPAAQDDTPKVESDWQRAVREQRVAFDEAVDEWNAKLEAAKHELRREGKPADLIKLVLLDLITEIEDELAVDYDLVDEGDGEVTIGEFARRSATNLARSAAAWSLANQWTLPPGFPEKPQYVTIPRDHYDEAGKFIPEIDRPLPDAPDATSEMQHPINPDVTLPCIGCGGNPTPYLTQDGYAICDGICLTEYEAQLEGDDEPEAEAEPYPELSDSEEAAEEATWD